MIGINILLSTLTNNGGRHFVMPTPPLGTKHCRRPATNVPHHLRREDAQQAKPQQQHCTRTHTHARKRSLSRRRSRILNLTLTSRYRKPCAWLCFWHLKHTHTHTARCEYPCSSSCVCATQSVPAVLDLIVVRLTPELLANGKRAVHCCAAVSSASDYVDCFCFCLLSSSRCWLPSSL